MSSAGLVNEGADRRLSKSLVNPTRLVSSHTRLVDAAVSLLWERGYRATTVEDICRQARVKKGGFYYFFPSKTDLVLAAIEESWSRAKENVFDSVVSNGGGGLCQITKLVDLLAVAQSKDSGGKEVFLGCPFGNLGQEMAREDEKIGEALRRIFGAYRDFIETALVQAEQKGSIPTGDNSKRAGYILALLEGAMLFAKLDNNPQFFRGVIDSVMAVAES